MAVVQFAQVHLVLLNVFHIPVAVGMVNDVNISGATILVDRCFGKFIAVYGLYKPVYE